MNYHIILSCHVPLWLTRTPLPLWFIYHLSCMHHKFIKVNIDINRVCKDPSNYVNHWSVISNCYWLCWDMICYKNPANIAGLSCWQLWHIYSLSWGLKNIYEQELSRTTIAFYTIARIFINCTAYIFQFSLAFLSMKFLEFCEYSLSDTSRCEGF